MSSASVHFEEEQVTLPDKTQTALSRRLGTSSKKRDLEASDERDTVQDGLNEAYKAVNGSRNNHEMYVSI